MQQLIEKMVTDFERGKLSRRQLAATLAGLVAAGANAAPSASDFKAVGVNHVTLRVPDVQRSTNVLSGGFRDAHEEVFSHREDSQS